MSDIKTMYVLIADYLVGEKEGKTFYGVYASDNNKYGSLFSTIKTVVEEDSPSSLGKKIGEEYGSIIRRAGTSNLSFNPPFYFPTLNWPEKDKEELVQFSIINPEECLLVQEEIIKAMKNRHQK